MTVNDELDDLRERLYVLEADVTALKARNARVEGDKAWETSRFRVALLSLLTYAVTALIFWLIAVPHPLRNAAVPAIAFCLSTQSLPHVKSWWLARRNAGGS